MDILISVKGENMIKFFDLLWMKINMCTPLRDTPEEVLTVAVIYDKFKFVRRIIEKYGINPAARNNAAAHYAAFGASSQILTYLLNHPEVNFDAVMKREFKDGSIESIAFLREHRP